MGSDRRERASRDGDARETQRAAEQRERRRRLAERHPRYDHLAGELGAVTLEALLQARWLARRPKGRAIVVTRRGREGLREALGLDVVAAAPGCA